MDLNIRRAKQWQSWIDEALTSLRGLPFAAGGWARVAILDRAASCLRVALSYANSMNCQARKRLCLRVLSWIRTEIDTLSKNLRSAA